MINASLAISALPIATFSSAPCSSCEREPNIEITNRHTKESALIQSRVAAILDEKTLEGEWLARQHQQQILTTASGNSQLGIAAYQSVQTIKPSSELSAIDFFA